MTKIILTFLTLISLTSSYAMRAPLRARPCQRPALGMALRVIAPRLRANLPHSRYSTEHEEHTEAKRQEAWLRMKVNVAEKVIALKTKGTEHRAKATQHTQYARTYETLAELEKDKFELFELTINKLNESAKYFEEPNIEAEANLIKVLTETYEEFYNALPNDEKNLDDKF